MRKRSGSLVFVCFIFVISTFAKTADGGIFGAFSNVITYFHTRYSEFCKNPPPEGAFLTSPQLIRSHGYPVEEHKIQTKDGYILTVFRIPYGKRGPMEKAGKEPVFVQHGILACSSDWLLGPNPDNNLPYVLVNNGYDVWLGNARGNNYSTDPTIFGLTSDDPKYYDFSLDDFAEYDVPAVIQYIQKATQNKKISVVCFSLGCSMVSFAINYQPRLNEVIRKMVFLAPGIYSEHMKSPLQQLLISLPNFFSKDFSDIFTGGRVVPKQLETFMKSYGPYICNSEAGRELCDNVIFLIGGYNREQMTNITTSLVSGHAPSTTSSKLLHQLSQMDKKNELRRFDYGKEENQKRYGAPEPPLYYLSHVRVPVQGYYGLNDLLATEPDVFRVFRELGNLVSSFQVSEANWTHLDFMWAKDAKFYVYNHVIKFLDK